MLQLPDESPRSKSPKKRNSLLMSKNDNEFNLNEGNNGFNIFEFVSPVPSKGKKLKKKISPQEIVLKNKLEVEVGEFPLRKKSKIIGKSPNLSPEIDDS